MKIRLSENLDSERKIKIKFEKFDLLNVDHDLSLIIYEVLKELFKVKDGIPSVDNKDVPKRLRSDKTHCPEKWKWVTKKILKTFKGYAKNGGCWAHDIEEIKKYQKGMKLFAKYFTTLWT